MAFDVESLDGESQRKSHRQHNRWQYRRVHYFIRPNKTSSRFDMAVPGVLAVVLLGNADDRCRAIVGHTRDVSQRKAGHSDADEQEDENG